ncbi:MAG: stage II sporulation protein D, partial [Clostridia bacterium]|nr:stage II sporulation protein D [Clostridia bacterium]
MKFIKTKIAILMLISYIIPCVAGLIFTQNNIERTIKIYDVQNSSVIEMSVNEYLVGVVAAEMPADFEPEALKAQSVAARTYLVHKGSCSNHPECSICTDPAHCQAYKSNTQLKQQWGNDYYKYYLKIANAVNATRDEIIVYRNQPISAVFHSTSSGRTENSEDVWSEAVPYLKSTDSSVDEQSPKFSSENTVSVEEFKNTILSENAEATFESDIIGEITRTQGGSVDTIVIGGIAFRGTQ